MHLSSWTLLLVMDSRPANIAITCGAMHTHHMVVYVCVCVCVLGAPKVLSNAQRLEQLNYQACLRTIKFLYVLFPDHVQLCCFVKFVLSNQVRHCG